MSPSEILASLRDDAAEETWRALDALVREQAARVIRAPHDREELAQTVMFKFAQRCASGTLTFEGSHDGEVVRYLQRMLRNLSVDAYRRGRREVPLDPLSEPGTEGEAREPEVESVDAIARLRGLLDRVCAVMLEGLGAAYREGRAQARREVEALYFEERTVEEMLRASGELEGEGEGAVKKAIDRAMKQHQRYRDGMIQTAEAMLRRGEIDETERRAVERAVLEMKRR